MFQLAGLLHPRLRTALLPRELLNKRNRTIAVHIGTPIPFSRLKALDDDAMTAQLRLRCYALAAHDSGPAQPACLPGRAQEDIAAAVAAPLLCAEVEALPQEQLLDQSGEFQVWYARAGQMPWLLQEIGRLREITFRAAGEGTGSSRDIDLYDAYYLHLFIWDKEQRRVVGAYRLGLADEIARRFGVKGLYTHSLFRYRRHLLQQLGPAIELGRSFVRPEYQRSYSPLLLLWKGIGQFVARHPHYRTLFGPVSISGDYATQSQQLLVQFLRANNYLPQLARLVRPRRPFRAPLGPVWLRHNAPGDLDQLSELVSAMERDQKGVPVLLRQYLKLGGHILGFNVDEAFNNALDGLIMVDLRQTDPKVLAKYMGREQAAHFRVLHGAAPAQDADPIAK
jgi:putative hemolysin